MPQLTCPDSTAPSHHPQYSRIPEENETVTYTAFEDRSRVYSREEALRDHEVESVPLSLCPDSCSRHG